MAKEIHTIGVLTSGGDAPGATLFTIGLATPSSTIVQVVLCIIWFLVEKRKEKHRMLIKQGETNRIEV